LGTTERGYFTRDFERKVRFYQEILFIGDSERYVKEGSGKGPVWKPRGRARFTGDFGRRMMEDCKRSISLYGSSVRGTWREDSFTGDPVGYVNEGSGNGHLYLQSPGGEPGGRVRLPGTLRDRRRALCKQCILSLWELCEGNLEGGLLYWELKAMYISRKALEMEHLSFYEIREGNLEGGLLKWDSVRHVIEGSGNTFLLKGSIRGN
jgi:hypothetical protein